jgi:hypothetical protein
MLLVVDIYRAGINARGNVSDGKQVVWLYLGNLGIPFAKW